jgi:hypothetical protein
MRLVECGKLNTDNNMCPDEGCKFDHSHQLSTEEGEKIDTHDRILSEVLDQASPIMIVNSNFVEGSGDGNDTLMPTMDYDMKNLKLSPKTLHSK